MRWLRHINYCFKILNIGLKYYLLAASDKDKPKFTKKNIISQILQFICLCFNEGLHEHGLREQLNDQGCAGDIHVFNDTEPSPAHTTWRSGARGTSIFWQRCIVGWNRLIEVRWLRGMSNERLPCWHDSFHTSAKLLWVSRKLLSFCFTLLRLSENSTHTNTAENTFFERRNSFPATEQIPSDICIMAALHISCDQYMMTHTVNPLVVWFSLMVVHGDEIYE